MKKIAFLISRIFDPAFLTALSVLFAIWLSDLSKQEKVTWLLIFECFAFIIPLIIFEYQRRKHIISDVDITDRFQRLPLFRSLTLLWAVSFYLAISFHLPVIILATIGSGFFIIAIWTIITYYWKISAHIGGATAFVILSYFVFKISWMVWAGPILILLIAWSRFILKKHTLKQIVGAFILASVIVFSVVKIFNLL